MRRSTNSLLTTESFYSKKTLSPLVNNYLFIPCINCNDLVNVDEIGNYYQRIKLNFEQPFNFVNIFIYLLESHSNHCTTVKEEVIIAEKSVHTYHTVDFKLKKLHEHITKMKENEKENPEFVKEAHNISLLLQYISDVINISKIDHKNITSLKRHLKNVDVSFNLYRHLI
jgi:hypothetical protein